MAQDQWTLQEKKKQSNTGARAPLQARVAAANRTVLQLANMMKDPGAHGMNRGKAK